MIRILLISILLIGSLVADTSIKLKKGWQFIGFPTKIDDAHIFNRAEVDILWGYDAVSQKWLGYAPDTLTQEKIDKRYKRLTSIDAWQGIWIHNKSDWSLILQEDTNQESNISLSKGWNLISLPNDMTISPTLFQDAVIWKYHDSKWQLFAQNSDTSHIAPPISKIDSAEAIWVKSRHTQQISLSAESSSLHTFASKKEMESYIKEMALASYIPRFYDYPLGINGIPMDTVLTVPEASDDANTQKAEDTTSTNLQEEDVDESDILKHNDKYIFFYNRSQNIIHISTFSDHATAQKSSIKPITLPANTFLQAMFIKQNKLIMIHNQQRYYYMNKIEGGIVADKTSMPYPIKEEQATFTLDIYNIEDINSIEKLSSTTLDGTFQNSRVVENSLYIISQFSPRLTITYPRIYIEKEKCQEKAIPILDYVDGYYVPECGGQYYDGDKFYRYDYSKPTITDAYLIPTINKGEKDLITHDTFYAPCKLNQFPTITSISKFDLSTNSFEKSVSLAGNTNKLYASSQNIYLTSVHYPYYYDFRNFQEREMIYKFSIGDNFDYMAKGFVDGVMLNQFSMSEKDDILRVASTTGDGWRGETNNFIFTLRQEDEKLNIEGTLSGLGHKGERIRGVRFLGDRGYLVTFRQTDPLYTLDISDPANPRKVGELNVTGFSSYIHPVDDNLILTLGRDATREGRQTGFKVSLYDISDFAHPTKADEKIYSASLGGFDAEYNHQAFIYRKSDKLFGITYHDSGFSKMDIFQINIATEKIEAQDQLSIASHFYENRGIIFNLNSHIYSTLFTGDLTTSKEIGAVQ